MLQVPRWKEDVVKHHYCIQKPRANGKYFVVFILFLLRFIISNSKIWIHVPSELPNVESQKGSGTLRGVIEKKTMINLVS
jgi:hypothetical protein